MRFTAMLISSHFRDSRSITTAGNSTLFGVLFFFIINVFVIVKNFTYGIILAQK